MPNPAWAALDKEVTRAQAKVERLSVADLDVPTERLPARRKRLSDGLKMLAFQVESDLFRVIASFYARAEDAGRTFIQPALKSGGDLHIAHGQLHVTLAAQSSPHRTRAIAALCELLNKTETRFPGSDLRVCYAIKGAACDT